MNRLNIGSPWVESVLVTRKREVDGKFLPPVHTNGRNLESNCYEPMAIL